MRLLSREPTFIPGTDIDVLVHIYVARLQLLINDTRRGHNTRQPSPSCWNFLSMVIPFDSFMHSDVYVQCVLIHVHFSLLVPLTSWSVDCDCYTRLSVIPLHRYLFLFRSYPSHCCWDLFLVYCLRTSCVSQPLATFFAIFCHHWPALFLSFIE